jgi:hypothetical protein
MKLYEIIQEMTVYGQQPEDVKANLPQSLARMKEFMGSAFPMRVNDFLKIKNALEQGDASTAQRVMDKFRKESNITVIMGDGMPGALQSVYQGNQNAVHHDASLIYSQWFRILNTVAAGKGISLSNEPTQTDKWRDPNVAGYSFRRESIESAKEALLEMGVSSKYHDMLTLVGIR